MKIEFTIEQLGVVDRALQQIPYYLAAPLIADINKQIQQQFDLAKDDGPTGQTSLPDQCSGD
jgi:hypothetical protein